MGSNRFWHIVSVVKERLYASLSCRVANNNLIRVTDPQYLSTRVHLLKSLFHTSPQPPPHLPRIPPLTIHTIETFPHFPKFFSRIFSTQKSLHLIFSKIAPPANCAANMYRATFRWPSSPPPIFGRSATRHRYRPRNRPQLRLPPRTTPRRPRKLPTAIFVARAL